MSTNDYLAAVAVKHGFQDYMEVSHRDIRNQIQGFIAAQNKKGHQYIHEVTIAFQLNFTQYIFFSIQIYSCHPRPTKALLYKGRPLKNLRMWWKLFSELSTWIRETPSRLLKQHFSA